MTSEELAYCAGVIDSDGTIQIRRVVSAVKNGTARNANFMERVSVRQVTPEAIDLFEALFGGARGFQKPPSTCPQGRTLHRLELLGPRAVVCLTALLPYLRVKRKQAENCLRMRDATERSKIARRKHGGVRGCISRPPELTDEMEAIFADHKTLNRFGVAATA